MLLRKLDDTLIPEYVEIPPKALSKGRINLEDVVILLDDVDDLNHLGYL
ncbi:hypothetical protein [Pyrobaculum ferrireducens]|uniref:Uncharacterized protein n=1 Tax=Pyrobaculum ferrireducens TaxID=1104324 RepID=G7VDE9_9CREN|nr:hypothetical protein [Pyrobaculum ferrireducens]AET32734.1 hypothetical protein P186_1305 [Pyrobaculum ferrireducens]